VCSDVAPPIRDGHEGEVRAITHREVTRVFGCTRIEKHRYAVESSDGGAAAAPEREVPQRLVAGAESGADVFQIRAGVVGEPPSERPVRLMRAAVFGAERPGVEQLSELSVDLERIAVAQAEYYFDGLEHTDSARQLWSMRWRARLRRFTWPDSDADGHVDGPSASTFDPGALQVSLEAACAASLSAAGGADGLGTCARLRELAADSAH
jgi:hypothetical protein